MTDEVVRLKAEVRELQEALAAERAKPVLVDSGQVQSLRKQLAAERAKPVLVDSGQVQSLRKQLATEQRRARELARYLEGLKRGRNDK